MKRFLLVIAIITFTYSLCQKAWGQSNQTINNGTFTSAVNFQSAACIYNWVNNQPGIGLPASGTGNIPAFIALNDSDTPITATIIATTSSGCPPVTFTISVNPTIPAITTTTTPITLNTIYGTASSSKSFNVAGVNLKEGVLVTPPAGFEVSTDNINFSKTVTLNSDNAQLSYINLNPDVVRTSVNGTSDYNYSSTVDNSVQSIQVTPVAASALATIKVNGQVTVTGLPSAPIALSPGANIINITVTAQNGITTKTYNITVTRAGSSDATLAGLTTDQGVVGPTFSPATTDYTTTVYSSAITITPIASNDGATVKVNGIVVPSGASSPNIPLSNANNIITIVVTAQDGVTTKTYTLTVISTKSSNAGLSQLFLTPAATLTQITGTTNYTATVPSSVNSVQQTAVASDINASVKVNGVAVAWGTASNPIVLNANGSTTITTAITAQDGITTQTYTISINKASVTNTGIAKLSITPAATLIPVTGTNNYTTSVNANVAAVQLTVGTINENATIKINNQPLAFNTLSNPIALNAGAATTITVLITSANGTSTRTYLITVLKNGSSDAKLSNILLTQPGTITQIFGTNNYTTSVSPLVNSVQQKIIPDDPNASIQINGISVAAGVSSPPITLNATGNTIITTLITAEDGKTKQTYTLTISKNGATNTGVSSFFLTPAATLVSTGSNNYTTSVSAETTSIQQTVVPSDANAIIKINGVTVTAGMASNPIPLNPTGTTAITTVITAQDGVTKRTIVTTVSKNGSTNTNIDQLLLNPAATFTPIPGTNNFTTSVIPAITNVDQTVFTNDPNATITINGVAVASGAPSPPISLNATGTTSITIIVTAPNKTTTKTYTVIISKNGSTNTDISQLYLSPSTTLTPIAGTNNYITSVGTGINSIKLTAIPVDNQASITINGIPVASGASSNNIVLNATGITTINTTVTAQDGISTKTYTITVTRGSNGELLSPLTSNLPSTPVYIRLTSITPADIYQGDVMLSSGSTNATIPLVNCLVNPAPLTITTGNITKNYGAALIDIPQATTYNIITGILKNGNTITSVMISYTAGAAADATASIYRGAIKLSAAMGANGFISNNYDITYIPANITVLPVALTITADNKAKDFGADNPPLTLTYKGFVNSDGPEQLLTQPGINTTAGTRSPIGQYPITVSGAASPNYVFTYISGQLTVSAGHLVIFIPNTITPNGDGINDTWNIKGVDAYPNTVIDIFNRQGQKVFTSNGYGIAWDGTYKGNPLPAGTYYYFIKNSMTTMSGSLTIIR